MSASPKTWRDVQKRLWDLGAIRVRTKGSHEHWRFPDGEMFIVVCNHLGDDAPRWVVARLRRVQARRDEAQADSTPKVEHATASRTQSQVAAASSPAWSCLACTQPDSAETHA